MIDVDAIRECLDTSILKIQILPYEEVDSTNVIAKEQIADGADEGLLIIAEKQTMGRGRKDRCWHSPVGGLYFSLIVKPRIGIINAPLMGLLASCATAQGLRAIGAQHAYVKWPNDILLDFDKVSGILSEIVTVDHDSHLIIIGIGINQNSTSSDFPDDFAYSVTTVRDYLGCLTSQEGLLCHIINSFDNLLKMVESTNSFKPILETWKELSSTIGNRVRITDDSQTYIGIATDILDDGSLLVQTDKGEKIVTTGDVRHLRND